MRTSRTAQARESRQRRGDANPVGGTNLFRCESVVAARQAGMCSGIPAHGAGQKGLGCSFVPRWRGELRAASVGGCGCARHADGWVAVVFF